MYQFAYSHGPDEALPCYLELQGHEGHDPKINRHSEGHMGKLCTSLKLIDGQRHNIICLMGDTKPNTINI